MPKAPIDFPILLTVPEQAAVIMALAMTRGDAGAPEFDESEAAAVVDWAEDARRQRALLDLVLEGKIALDYRDDDIHFQVNDPKTAERFRRVIQGTLAGEHAEED